MGLFNDADLESPQFGSDVSGGGDLPQMQVPNLPPAPLPNVPRTRSIMERMRDMAASLVQPAVEENPSTSILGGIGQAMVGFSEGYQGRGGAFLRDVAARDTAIKQAQIERGKLGLEALKEQRAAEEERRKANREELKNKAYEELADFDFSSNEMKTGKKLGRVVSTLLQAGDHTTAAGLIKMVQDASQNEEMRNALNVTTNRLKLAKNRDEANTILLEMSPKLAKEQHAFLENIVKSMFPDEKEKSFNANDLSAFVASNGRQRGPTIPADMTVKEARDTLTEMRTMQQQQINVTTNQQTFQRGASIKDDYTKQVQPYMAARENQRKFEDLTKQGNKITDLALVRQGMMAMDPPNAPSIVRESEAELVERARGSALLQPLAFHIERILGKRTLTDEQRDQIKTLVRQSYNARRQGYMEQRKIYGDFAREAGLRPESVLGEELSPIVAPPKSKSTPKYKVTEVGR